MKISLKQEEWLYLCSHADISHSLSSFMPEGLSKQEHEMDFYEMWLRDAAREEGEMRPSL